MLTIHINFSDLDGFLSLKPTFSLLDDLNIDALWLPISSVMQRLSDVQPEAKASDPLAAYKAKRRTARYQFEVRELHRNCSTLGISETQGQRRFDATNAHIGLLFLEAININPRLYIEAVYDAVFVRDQDLEDRSSVSLLLATLGVEAGFTEFLINGRDRLEELQQKLLQEGIFGCPAYVLEGNRYHGRQHLPLIRWHLGGREGVAPV